MTGREMDLGVWVVHIENVKNEKWKWKMAL